MKKTTYIAIDENGNEVARRNSSREYTHVVVSYLEDGRKNLVSFANGLDRAEKKSRSGEMTCYGKNKTKIYEAIVVE